MKKAERLSERKARYDAYSGKDGVTYHHHTEPFDVGITNIWHYLKDVTELEFQQAEGKFTETPIDSSNIAALEARAAELKEAASYIERMAKLKESWASSPDGLLSKLLDRAVSSKPFPRSSQVYMLRAKEFSDALSMGSCGAWQVGLIGARKARGLLTLDIQLSDVLLQDEDIRRQAYGFAAGAVAMKCIPYDRGKKHRLGSVFVRPTPNMEHPFSEFDYVLEMLQKDQCADIRVLNRLSDATAKQAGLTAVRAVHSEELARLGEGS